MAPKLLIRPAGPADALAVAQVHVRSWRVGYRGLLPDTYLDALKPEDRARRYTFGDTDPLKPATLVALADGVIRGFATTMPSQDRGGAAKGELAGLYVDPEQWGRGIGTLLLTEVLAHLAAQGCSSAELWVLAGNTRAQHFYERHGWQVDGVTRNQEIWGIAVQESRYTRRLP